MLKKILVFGLLFIVSIQSMWTLTGYSYSSQCNCGPGNDVRKKYIDIFVSCGPTQANLYCWDENDYGSYCMFENATLWSGCDEIRVAYNDAMVEDLFDHAKDQMELCIWSGTYTNNLLVSPLGKKWGRTVSWSLDTTTHNMNIDVNISEIE